MKILGELINSLIKLFIFSLKESEKLAQAKNENIEKLSKKAEAVNSKLSKFQLLDTTYYFIFFFVLAWICFALG